MSRLNEIKERAAAATAGEWILGKDKDHIYQTAHVTRDIWNIPRNEADLVFIAHAREDVPWLVEAVEECIDLFKVLADDFDECKRQSAERDEPEGACFISLSDTLAKELSEKLRTVVNKLETE